MKYIINSCKLLIVTLIMILLVSCKEKTKTVKEVPGVFIQIVDKQDITETKELVGQTVSKEDVNLVARIEGELIKKNFQEGHIVKKGQVLFEIEKDLYKSKVDAASAGLKNAEAIRRHAEIEQTRQGTLVKKDAVSQQSYDNAEVALQKANANIELCKAKLEEARINLGYTTIKAPFNGLIGLSNYDVGNIVNPQNGLLANIVNVDPIEVEFPISEKIYTSIMLAPSIGAKKRLKLSDFETVLILPNGTKYMHKGEINFLNNRINPSTGTLLLRATFPNSEHILLPGQYVKIRLKKKKRIYALVIPNSVTQIDKDGPFIFVVNKNNIVEKRRVSLGDNIRKNVIIKEGISEGEQVIVEGIQKVYGGLKVNPLIKKNK